MKIKILIEADIDMTEVKKNPILRILRQLKKIDKSESIPTTTSTLINLDGIIQVQPVAPADNILRFP